MSSLAEIYIRETIKVFSQNKSMAEQALIQLEEDTEFFKEFGPRSHSIAVNVKHVGGNLRSRWRDFLSTDGEKEDRDRDNEFVILPENTRENLMQIWEDGWKILLDSLEGLRTEDLEKTVTVRSEPHSVPLAIQRSLAHTAHHVGQILYLCRLVKSGEWRWLTVAPGESKSFNAKMKGSK